MERRKVVTPMRLAAVMAVFTLCFHQGIRAQNGKGQGVGPANGPTSCVVNGKTISPCPPGLAKQSKREAARRSAGLQKKGVRKKFAGISPATSAYSPLATGPTALAAMTPGVPPDYFGVSNYANSPLPVLDATGAITLGTGMRKFVDTLPGLTVAGANNLGSYIPLAVADTATFPGSDYYRIGLREYSQKLHSDLTSLAPAGTVMRGYYDLNNPADSTNHYLGPLILASRNRPVRVLFQDSLATNLNIPVDTTYMGAGAVSDGVNSGMASQKRAVLHLHGGNTPWISDGTPHQWVTPNGDLTALPATGFAKGFSFQNVPDMVGAGKPITAPNVTDGMGTFYWTNQQSGRLMFYHDHAYGTTRLNVYGGEAAGYLLVDGNQETLLRSATAPGTILTNPDGTVNLGTADLAHLIPLVIQDKTFVPEAVTQLPAQDPTWDLANWGGPGNFWFPHVYTPNQNPADLTGANGFGRWDWGPWFWPPQNPATLLLPSYACNSIATPAAGWAFPPLMCPGVPDPTRPAPSNSPSGVPEGFMDTPLVNGTAYPKLTVAPAAYRFQVLNAANDRTLNLGLYVAEPVTLSPVITNPGANYTAPVVTVSCAGGTAIASVGSGVFGGVPFVNGITGITMTSQPLAGCLSPTITIADTAPGVGSGATASAVMSQNTEVKMVSAVPVAARPATLPNCSSALAPPMAGGGLVTALLDASGNPLYGTGLPTGGTGPSCWPLYNSAQGYTAGPMGENGQLSWGNSDGRLGGVPDPSTAGPPIIQIGAEGGIMPQVAVIPSTAVSYDYNKRSITVLNVLNHGLYLGPAERADIIIDFSAFNGKTLILYNDAPAPVPGADPRIDYFTNDPDYSSSGGAPTTMAGYGPNTRTIMQIQVSGSNPNVTPFSLSALTAAAPSIFAATQDPVIVPEPAYPVANGNGPATLLPIQATSITAWVGGPVGSLFMTSAGAGYTVAPAVTIAPPCIGPTCTGTIATATTILMPTSVASVALGVGGSGYTSPPAVTITGGGGSSAAAKTTLSTRSVASVTVTNGGNGYTSVPLVTFSPPPAGTTAVGTAIVTNRKVTGVTVTNPGSGYVTAPTVGFTGGGGSGAAATANLAPTSVASITLTASGSGYTSAPLVAIAPPQTTGTTATATATLTGTPVASLTLTNPGSGYSSAPAVTIGPSPLGPGSTATALALPPTLGLQPKTIQELFTLDYGRMNATLGVEVPFTNFLTQTTIPYGYVDPPTEIFKDGETQLWKITHNGVDTHFIHFHLFTVQVINRVGWDGAIKPPDPNEMGFKDTVRMNPLEDIIVALRPFKQSLPWPIPNSNRPMDTTKPVGVATANQFTNVDPTNQPAAVINQAINFGWEYVWHCHILGHEENDMMRAMVLAVAPNLPANPVATLSGSGNNQRIGLTLGATIVANTAVPSGFTVQRAVLTGGVPGAWTTLGSVPAVIAGTSATAAYTDTTVARKTTYAYRAIANNLVGYTQVYATPAVGYPHPSADSAPSGQSNSITTN